MARAKLPHFKCSRGLWSLAPEKLRFSDRLARKARSHTGYLTQTFSLYPDLTVFENIRYIGELRRVPLPELKSRGLRYLKMFDMDRFEDRLAGRLSGGMKQKLALACALVAEASRASAG